MELPPDTTLPFFAYGTLRPGEIAYFRIKPSVLASESDDVRGTLWLRDGLLIADERGASKIAGEVLQFDPAAAQGAYQAICELEPGKQYQWGRVDVQGRSTNILWGKNPRKGSRELDFEWSSWKDPLFTDALEVVVGQLESHSECKWDLKNAFHIQMGYLLLWTSIERYASLRYHLRSDATKKVMKIAEEPAFRQKLGKLVSKKRSVQRADDPTKKLELDPADPKGSMEYYYQVRSNMVHRGKGTPQDHDLVLSSCRELVQIFRHVLVIAQEEAKGRRRE